MAGIERPRRVCVGDGRRNQHPPVPCVATRGQASAGRSVTLVNHLERNPSRSAGRRIRFRRTSMPEPFIPGLSLCEQFSDAPWPTWQFACRGIRLEGAVCPHGRDLVILRWRLLDDISLPVVLRVRPMLTGRDFRDAFGKCHIAKRGDGHGGAGGLASLWGLPAVRALHNGQYHHQPDWYRHIHYRVEQERGLDHVEDWWSPGECLFTLSHRVRRLNWCATETMPTLSVTQLVETERRRRAGLVSSAPTEDELTRRLWVASNAYLVQRGARQTVIAGYPWFADWGRDTFAALPGSVWSPVDMTWHRQVIEAFASYVSWGWCPIGSLISANSRSTTRSMHPWVHSHGRSLPAVQP